MRRLYFKIAALSGLTLVAAASGAFAQNVTNVVEQARYANAPDGIRSGSIIFFPSISLSEVYDDNIYRRDNDEEDDFITVVRPGLNITTDFDVHSLFFRTNANLGYYRHNDDENYEDYSFAGGGTLDVAYGTFFSLYSSYQHAHETREDPDAASFDEPVEYDLINNKLGFTRALGIIKLYLEGMFDRFIYEDTTLNGNDVDNSGRDRDIYTAYGKLAYEYFPGYNIYTSLRQDWRRYDEAGAVSRDSDGYEILMGTDLDITGKVKGDVYVGYLERKYDDPALESIDALSYGGSLIWNLTGLTSLTASVNRSVEETTFGDASGDLRTRYELGIDHLLRHNMFLNGTARYIKSDYESNRNAGREDDIYQAGLNLEYIPRDGLTFRTGYNYSIRESNVSGEDYEANRFTVGLSLQF